MLQNISIRDFAIVPAEELEFSDGFTVITGETGAGKSLIVDALGLLSGRRADTDLIRQGSEKAELSAEFELTENHPAHEWLCQAEMEDDCNCLIRRVISRSGRSRAWINGTPVTLNQLQELGTLLVEIHGQNEHIRLNQTEERFRLLDGGGEYSDVIEQVTSDYRTWHAARSELERLRQTAVLDPAEIELLTHQLSELEAAALPPEAVADLEKEQRRLSRGHEFSAALESSDQILTGGGPGDGGVVDQLHQAMSNLADIKDDDARIADAASMLQEAAINCEEALQSIQKIISDVDLSPERLNEVEQQLSQLHDLARKHRVALEDLLKAREDLAERIETSRSMESKLAACEESEKEALEAYRKSSAMLSKRRTTRAAVLEKAITNVMQGLSMEGGSFGIEVVHDVNGVPAIRGSDQIILVVSGTAGAEPGPLGKVASGGELSRVSLAIKVANYQLRDDAANQPGISPVQIFDEVDAGVGGDTANAVGRMLRAVADGAQTLCVTHLAQVAARAHHQVKIEKSSKQDEISVNAMRLEPLAREEEIARMLSGKVSENSLAHARELIENSAA